jgi:hypothetical protein
VDATCVWGAALVPRGVELSPPGTRFRQTVLAAMPDIDAMKLVERFFDLGTLVVGMDHAVAIFLAGCRECLPEWEAQATQLLQRVTPGPCCGVERLNISR